MRVSATGMNPYIPFNNAVIYQYNIRRYQYTDSTPIFTQPTSVTPPSTPHNKPSYNIPPPKSIDLSKQRNTTGTSGKPAVNSTNNRGLLISIILLLLYNTFGESVRTAYTNSELQSLKSDLRGITSKQRLLLQQYIDQMKLQYNNIGASEKQLLLIIQQLLVNNNNDTVLTRLDDQQWQVLFDTYHKKVQQTNPTVVSPPINSTDAQ